MKTVKYGTIGAMLVAMLAAANAFAAGPYHVDASRPDDSGDGLSWAAAKKTIQAAVDLAAGGETVWVTNGTYRGTGDNVVEISTNITLKSVNGYAYTTIDGQGARRGMHMLGTVDNGIVDGFTITNGLAPNHGGGVWVSRGTVQNCLITGNAAPSFGGGVFINNEVTPPSLLRNCIVTGNDATLDGGGVTFYYGGEMENCLIYNNTSSRDGGGVGTCDGEIRNCTIVGNTADDHGDGVATILANNGSAVQNCIIWGNGGSDPDLYSDYGNVRFEYNCIESVAGTAGYGTAGTNNITSNPRFANASGDDYRPVFGSPCIDGGMDLSANFTDDLSGGTRPFDGDGDGTNTYDMGAYEYANTPKTLYVAPGGSHGDFLSWATAANDIQSALNAAHSAGGDTVLVSNHTYTAAGAEVANVSMPVTLRSLNGYSNTVINGQGARRGLVVSSPYAVVDGFTITNGYIANNGGGGVWINNNSSGFRQSGAVVQNCLIVGNANLNHWGGGAYIGPNGGVIRRCIIRNNSNNQYGAGLALYYGGLAENCLILGNNCGSGYGGGVALEGSSALIRHCTIVSNFCNTAANGAGLANLGGVGGWDGRGTVQNSIIYGNQAGRVDVRNQAGVSGRLNFYNSCIGTISGDYGTAGVSNITDNPLWVNAAAGNYRLKRGSPCIDSGMTIAAVTNDLDGVERPLDGNTDRIKAYDMGAYEAPKLSLGTVVVIR